MNVHSHEICKLGTSIAHHGNLKRIYAFTQHTNSIKGYIVALLCRQTEHNDHELNDQSQKILPNVHVPLNTLKFNRC